MGGSSGKKNVKDAPHMEAPSKSEMDGDDFIQFFRNRFEEASARDPENPYTFSTVAKDLSSFASGPIVHEAKIYSSNNTTSAGPSGPKQSSKPK